MYTFWDSFLICLGFRSKEKNKDYKESKALIKRKTYEV